jgi:hypothetical protein
MEINEETTMKKKDYIFVGLYVLLLGGWISTVIDRVDEEKEQFTKINNLNNDLIKISNYVSNNSKLLTSLEGEVYNNSLTLEDVNERLQEQYKTNTTFYEMYFSTQAQRVEKEEELVEEKVPNEERVLETIEQEEVVVPVEVPVVKITTASSCPTPHTRLLPYINHVRVDRTYSFIITYDVVNSEISNPRFNKKIPSRLRNAIINYVNSFQTRGDIQDCYVPIKILGG